MNLLPKAAYNSWKYEYSSICSVRVEMCAAAAFLLVWLCKLYGSKLSGRLLSLDSLRYTPIEWLFSNANTSVFSPELLLLWNMLPGWTTRHTKNKKQPGLNLRPAARPAVCLSLLWGHGHALLLSTITCKMKSDPAWTRFTLFHRNQHEVPSCSLSQVLFPPAPRSEAFFPENTTGAFTNSVIPPVCWSTRQMLTIMMMRHRAKPKESLKAISTGTSATESWKHT